MIASDCILIIDGTLSIFCFEGYKGCTIFFSVIGLLFGLVGFIYSIVSRFTYGGKFCAQEFSGPYNNKTESENWACYEMGRYSCNIYATYGYAPVLG